MTSVVFGLQALPHTAWSIAWNGMVGFGTAHCLANLPSGLAWPGLAVAWHGKAWRSAAYFDVSFVVFICYICTGTACIYNLQSSVSHASSHSPTRVRPTCSLETLKSESIHS